ncbi:MAG: fatty acid desaturase [Pseudanabaenaceae cyanobacterium bins.39]|nr:fatty acid desaturase [Pseudanabaenaceae cyanobacterium bins.39]
MYKLPQRAFQVNDWVGLSVVIIIVSLWIASLEQLIVISAVDVAPIWVILGVLGRTYLHTGLFIVAHDAMHQNLIPSDRYLNDWLGKLAVTLYGFLPYEHCHKNHTAHHRFTSQHRDPDFHGKVAHPFFWYCKFISEYFPWRSLIVFLTNMSIIFWSLHLLWHVPFTNLILFWILPLILSSLQLFIFGTYLPHRQVPHNPNFLPRLQGNLYTLIWSFCSCYNFGHYHWEHHEYPHVPWYQLPYCPSWRTPKD